MSLKKHLHIFVSLFLLLLCAFLGSPPAEALEAREVLVVANGQEGAGVALARFYMEQRNIPPENLLIIQTAVKEGIPRYYYDDEIAEPIREFLEDKPTISCLLLIYGIPLRIDGHGLNNTVLLEKENHTARRKRDPVASVDSELSLVRVAEHPVVDWIANPYFLQFQTEKTAYVKGQVLMVARLDGPDEKTVRRLITDSLQVEKKGLSGTAYFDARWPQPQEQKKLQGYGLYDNAIHEAAKITEKALPTVLDQRPELFQDGEAPDAALYCGWYSHAKYVDAFDWQQGAVAYHIASSECTTLKKEGSQVWCKRLLEEGVAATIGPVGEPYVQAFPFPQIFFGLLLDGDFTLAEAYFLSLPYISWKMVLIGDPLYQPFRSRGILP
ncbi:MAG: TIGR03790 family protein [Desulfocapsa sp.]|nr:MAG: TIGR03790 family protein [Desulfocapsa sp.]